MATHPQTIFISYASPNRDRVTPYANRLQRSGFDVWIDHKRLRPGQNWEYEIDRALDRAAIILVFISANSVDRRGYVQREVKFALDNAKEKLVTDIYLIPVIMVDGVEIPADLKNIQFVRAWESGSYQVIEEAIKHQLTKLGTDIQEAQSVPT
jgi:TIR domain-containing protein